MIWDKFNKIDTLYKETGGCDNALTHVDKRLLEEMRKRGMNVKEMKEIEIRKQIDQVVTQFYDTKSSFDKLNQFFSRCLHGILDESHWDDNMKYLHEKLANLGNLFERDLSSMLSDSSVLDRLSQHIDFINDIVKQSQSDIFTQLWTDVISNQRHKYTSNGGIKVSDMDCIDVCLFIQHLDSGKSMPIGITRGRHLEMIFKNQLDGKRLLKTKNVSHFNIDGLQEMINENTKFEWNGKLSLKLLSLMYEYMVKPRFVELKQGIANGFVPMKDVEYYFDKCDINTFDQVRQELKACGIIQNNISIYPESIMNGIKCTKMLHDEMMIINFLSLLRSVVEEDLEIDDKFRNLLEQAEQSQYPWSDGNIMADKGREALKNLTMAVRSTRGRRVAMITRSASGRIGNAQPTLKDILVIWQDAENAFFKDVECVNDENRYLRRKETNKYNQNVSNRNIGGIGDEFVLSATNKQWLRLCFDHANVIIGLFDRFGDDESFKKQKALSQYADPMSETRKNTLNQVRQYFVVNIGKHIVSQSMNMSEARLYLINKIFCEMKNIHVKYLEEFIEIWDEIDQNIDFRQSQYTRDRTILSKLAYFVLQNCNLEMTTREYEIPEASSPQPALKQSSMDDEDFKDDFKASEFFLKTKSLTKRPNFLTENEFENLVDRLLISENSDTRGQSLIELKKDLKQWTTNDVCSIVNARYNDNKYGDNLERIILDRGIDGRLLFKYHESQEHLMYLFFSQIDFNEFGTSDINKKFLDFDLTKLANITTRKSIKYDYGPICIGIHDSPSADEQIKLVCKDIVNDITRAIQVVVIAEQMNLLTPKYEIVKKILKTMKEYEIMGGRQDLLNQQMKIEIYDSDPDARKCKDILKEWENHLSDWSQMMSLLRLNHKYLSYFTVNEMRFMYNTWCNYQKNKSENLSKDECARILNGKFCAVNRSLTLEQTKKFLKEKSNFGEKIESDSDEREWFEELGKYLYLLFGEYGDNASSRMANAYASKHKLDFLQNGKPNVFYCNNKDRILSNVIKLYTSQHYLPDSSNILFCTQEMQSEEILCFLRRSCNNKKILHCLVTPEKLKSNVCDDLLSVLINEIQRNDALFSVIINDKSSKIYAYLSMYDMSIPLNLEHLAKEEFYRQCIATENFRTFLNGKSDLPFVRVYVSEKACVGKTYQIRKLAKNSNVKLVHIPCNTFKCDEKFVVERLCSNYESNMSSDDDNKEENKRVIFHLNVSSHCGKDLNVLLFKLLIMKYLSYSTGIKNGKSFVVTSNHAFFIELPCELSHEFESTSLRNVLNYFYFVSDDACIGQEMVQMNLNLFEPNSKHIFVLKYLDALTKGRLVIKGPAFNDWDWKNHDKKEFDSNAIRS